MSAEYIMASGNLNVILCERGIRTFETSLRNTLDLGVVPLLHSLSHLPVMIDPSHATGRAKMVDPVAVAAAAIGADGLIIEVHNDPPHAKCDGAQSQTPEMFAETMKKVDKISRGPRTYRRIVREGIAQGGARGGQLSSRRQVRLRGL